MLLFIQGCAFGPKLRPGYDTMDDMKLLSLMNLLSLQWY